MRVRHYEAIVTHNGLALGDSTTVYSHAFANRSVVSDDCNSVFPLELEILGDAGNHGTGEYIAVFTNPGTLHNRHIAADMRALTNLDILVDGHERIYDDAGMDFCRRMNIGKWLFHA